MDLNAVLPSIEKIVKNTLKERNYPFGGRPNSVYSGLSNKIATGGLMNSVKAKAQKYNDMDHIEIEMKNYGAFVEEGRKPGSYVPISQIMKWIQQKGIGVRNERGQFVKGHLKTKKQIQKANREGQALPVAFAIQKSIWKFGIRATSFTEIALYKISQDKKIINLIGDEAMDELMNMISVTFKEFKK
jgi:hypothetical protein